MQSNEYKILVVIATTIGIIATFGISPLVKAQVLERDPIPALPVVDNITGEAEPIQMTIDASESLPVNGTMTLQMQGMNDIDFKDTPPQGITVIVTNDSATVTNQPVQLPGAAAAAGAPIPSPPPAASSEGDDD